MARIAALATALCLSGCSAVQFAYDNAGAWVRWKADGYLDLGAAQRAELERRVAGYFAWHRADQLPKYAQLADEAGARLERGASREDMVWGYDAIRGQVRESLRRAGGDLGDFLDRLSPAQVGRFERQLAEDNRKFVQQWLDGTSAERRGRRLERLLHTLQDWLGELSDAQRERVREFNDRAPYNAELRDQDRRRRQGELLAMLRARDCARSLADWVAHWDGGRAPEYARAGEAYVDGLVTLLAELERSLSERQRAHAVARLREYARDFRALAAR